ncbi:MAG TPA: hypothetical protein VGP33_13325, partial [Chloroflexota bacterium]|nr:hypothetical protein [Chloroflexota bacterium]
MVAQRRIDPLDGILARAASGPAPELPHTAAEWQTWRPQALARVQQALAPWPERVPLAAEE